MNVATRKPVVILGAGLAGLTAAHFLHQNNVPVRLFEAGSKIAGLCQSFHDEDGFTYDFGAHFITNRLAKAVGIFAQCRTVRHYAETVWLGGKSYGYPFGLLRVPRMVAGGLAAKLSLANGRPTTAAEWFRRSYGHALADEVAIPLTEAWSGAQAEALAPTVGDGIANSIAQTLWLKLASRLTRRAVSCGYSRELPENPSVYHVYPAGGIGTVCQALAAELSGVLQLEAPVEKILVEDGHATGIRVNGREIEAAAVISTAPVNVLGKLMEGTTELDYLTRFRYRPMVFVNLRLQGRGLLPDVVTWTPEAQFPFFRLTETPLSMPWLAPAGKTIITVDIGCEKSEDFWQMDDERLGELCVAHLQPLIADVKQRYEGCRVMRTPVAYPVFLREYETERQQWATGTGIENLYSVGRNGEFMHIFMEDVYERTRQRMTHLTQSLAAQKRVSTFPLLSPKPQMS